MNALKVPAHLSPYFETLGHELGVKFLLAFGGSYIYLSAQPQERSPVAALVGVEQAAGLARRIGSGSLRIPTGKPFIAQYLKAKGWTVNMIARELHVTDVSVRNWLKKPDDRQLSLL